MFRVKQTLLVRSWSVLGVLVMAACGERAETPVVPTGGFVALSTSSGSCPSCSDATDSQENDVAEVALLMISTYNCDRIRDSLLDAVDFNRIVTSQDSTVWGRYWIAADEIEITEMAFEDDDEFEKTVVHEGTHREFGDWSESMVYMMEEECLWGEL